MRGKELEGGYWKMVVKKGIEVVVVRGNMDPRKWKEDGLDWHGMITKGYSVEISFVKKGEKEDE